MATLALPAPVQASPCKGLFRDSFAPSAFTHSEPTSACLQVSHQTQSLPAIRLASYHLNFVLLDNSLALASHPPIEQVSPRPYIYLKFSNDDGLDLSDEMFLGCTAELQFSVGLFLQALTIANLSASIYPIHDRVLPLTGLNAIFTFRNFPTGAHTVERNQMVLLFPRAAHGLPPEQSGPAASTGRTLSLQLFAGIRPLGAPVLIGRCL
jgi:hypothetical protein